MQESTPIKTMVNCSITTTRDTSVKLLKPIEADGDNSIEDTWIAENFDLFQAGDVFGKR